MAKMLPQLSSFLRVEAITSCNLPGQQLKLEETLFPAQNKMITLGLVLTVGRKNLLFPLPFPSLGESAALLIVSVQTKKTAFTR